MIGYHRILEGAIQEEIAEAELAALVVANHCIKSGLDQGGDDGESK